MTPNFAYLAGELCIYEHNFQSPNFNGLKLSTCVFHELNIIAHWLLQNQTK